ncbi:efflux RND transporter periplasmic adaptor subunit [Stratiformator vulcanicus]|uniref:Multidrug resistance protein MdtE n=1 Tax=Stratiformator vulcanicus TaxID=2527980 RepID=A0A517QWF8_9PLAN|nr:efflux RND transporter periplasmic adaptor subunit [Stratiformator vulcanicus]QDT35913.1 Multidrug resistance protein MdtE precursor [Stratiformator vulcanicus]
MLKIDSITDCFKRGKSRIWALALLIAAATFVGIPSADAEELIGFSEPYRTIDVAASQMGIVSKIHAREGDQVSAGDLVGELDHRVLAIASRIAEKTATSRSALHVAEAEANLSRERMDNLRSLHARNAASNEELERAEIEFQIAQARLNGAVESLELKQLEHERVLAEIEQRMIRSPIDGVVIRIHRDEGEFTSANQPDIATVVELNPLVAVFSTTRDLARNLKTDASVEVKFDDRQKARGIIEYISPVTEARSGTVEVRVRIPNPQLKLRSGERCSIRSN